MNRFSNRPPQSRLPNEAKGRRQASRDFRANLRQRSIGTASSGDHDSSLYDEAFGPPPPRVFRSKASIREHEEFEEGLCLALSAEAQVKINVRANALVASDQKTKIHRRRTRVKALYMAGRDIEAIAESVGVSTQTVRSDLKYIHTTRTEY